MSPLSMAASSVIPSPNHTKLPFNLTFPAHFPHSHYFSSSNPVDTIFLLRPLELANQTTSATTLLRPRRLSAAGLDDLDVDRGESFTDEDEDPVTDSENHAQESEDEENGENDGVGPSNDGRTIFFNGIPFSMTSAQVTELFDGVGQVENVELIWDMIMDRSRGFGYVTMATAEEANSVMRMFNGAVIGGRPWRLSFPKEPPSGLRREMIIESRAGSESKGSRMLVVRRLGFKITKEDVEQAFKDQPGFCKAEIRTSFPTGKSLGSGLLWFRTAEDALAALSRMQGTVLKGQTLLLKKPAPNLPQQMVEEYQWNSKPSHSSTTS